MNAELDPWGTPYGGIKYNEHPCFLVKNPCEYFHMRALRIALRVVSGWPGRELKEKNLFFFEGHYHALFNTSLSICFFILQLWYLLEFAANLTFFELGHMYVALLMNVLSTSRGFTLCLSQEYRNFAVKLLTEVHVFFHKDKSDYSRLVYAKVYQLCNWFCVYLFGIVTIALILFNCVPLYMNYRNGVFESFDPVNDTFVLAIYFKLPVDPEKNFKMYWYSFLLNWLASFLCAISIIMFDLFLSLMVINLWGHFKILLHSLDTFPRPATSAATGTSVSDLQKQAEIYSPQEQLDISVRLKESIHYHRMIVDFTDEMSQRFGMVLFVYYTFHQISGCLLLLECSQSVEALARYLPLTVMMTAQLIQISITFETIGSMSEKVKDEVYCLPWEYMNTQNRKTVMLFLINVQEPVHIKAGGLVDVSVTTMAGILKTSFSYFAFLRTMSV